MDTLPYDVWIADPRVHDLKAPADRRCTDYKTFPQRIVLVSHYRIVPNRNMIDLYLKKEQPTNLGGFSIWRFIGVSAFKSRLSRKIDIPLTKSGRRRKLGAWIFRLFGF